MLNALELTNFKAFGSKVRIPLAPITLIFGENSAGKSSILQALNLLQQTLESSDRRSPLLTSVDSGITDVGSFQSCLHTHDLSKTMTFGLEMKSIRSDHPGDGKFEFSINQDEAENPELTKASVYKIANANPSLEMKRVRENNPRTGLLGVDISKLAEKISDSTFEKYLNNKEELFVAPLKKSLKSPEGLHLSGTEYDDLVDAIKFHSGDVSREQLCNRITQLVNFNTVRCSNFIPRLLPLKKGRIWRENPNEEERLIKEHLFNQKFFDDEVSATDICGAVDAVEKFLNHNYHPIGPIRHEPKRVYVSNGLIPKGVGYNGGNVCVYLAHNKKTLSDVNEWLKRLKCAYSIDVDENEGRLGSTKVYELLLRDRIQQKEVQFILPDVG
jgi:hypothetical protein